MTFIILTNVEALQFNIYLRSDKEKHSQVQRSIHSQKYQMINDNTLAPLAENLLKF